MKLRRALAWASGVIAVVAFWGYVFFEYFVAANAARVPDALHRYHFSWKMTVYLTLDEAVLGYGLQYLWAISGILAMLLWQTGKPRPKQ